MENITLSTSELSRIVSLAKKEAREEAEQKKGPPQLFLKTSELMELTGLTRFRIDELRKKGQIPYKKLGGRYYFPTALITEWAENLEGEKEMKKGMLKDYCRLLKNENEKLENRRQAVHDWVKELQDEITSLKEYQEKERKIVEDEIIKLEENCDRLKIKNEWFEKRYSDLEEEMKHLKKKSPEVAIKPVVDSPEADEKKEEVEPEEPAKQSDDIFKAALKGLTAKKYVLENTDKGYVARKEGTRVIEVTEGPLPKSMMYVVCNTKFYDLAAALKASAKGVKKVKVITDEKLFS